MYEYDKDGKKVQVNKDDVKSIEEVLNIVNGFGAEVGRPLATNPRIAKIAFTGSTQTGQMVMQYATENIIPVTLELGGKSPNLFFEDIMDKEDDFLEKNT